MIAAIVFWTAAGLIAGTYVLFPALVLIRGWVWRRPYKTAEITPDVSLIVAAHNEAEGIAERIENALALDYPKDRLEIVIASDGSTDQTESIVARYAEGENGVRHLLPERPEDCEKKGCVPFFAGVRLLSLPRRGKIPTLNAAAVAARGEILVFSDANTSFAPGALRALLRPFADESVGGVAGNQVYTRPDKRQVSGGVVSAELVRFQSSVVSGSKESTHDGQRTTGHGPLTASLTADGECAYWDFDRLMKTAQSRSGSVTSATGAIYAIRRALFRPIPVGVTDDFVASSGVVAQGYRLVFAADAVAAEPVATATGTEFGRKVRVITQGLRAVGVMRELFNPLRHGFYAFQLFWHKVLRRLMVFPLVALFCAAFVLWNDGAVYRAAGMAQAAFYGCAILGLFLRGTRMGRTRALTIPVYFCMVNAAALVAVVNALRGRRIELWEPQRQATGAGAGGG